MDLQQLNSCTKQELIAIIVQLFERVSTLAAQNRELQRQVKTLQGQVKSLQAQLAQNSRNSSQPPSSDGYEKPQPKSQREKSERPSGGQAGHPGHTLKQVEHPDRIEPCAPVEVCGCGANLSHAVVIELERRQVFDLPALRPQVTEYQAQVKVCGRCGKTVRGQFPDHVSQPVQYGPRVNAAVSYLSQYQLLPYERLAQLLRDLFELDLSEGTIENVLKRGYEKLERFDRAVKDRIATEDLAHFDETGMRVEKALHWLHVACTETLTAYHIDTKRGEPAMRRMGILPRFEGKAVHDHWASYFTFRCKHILCNAHHLRELTFAEEQYHQGWAKQLKDCLLEALGEVQAAKDRGKNALPSKRRVYFSRRYSRILREGREQLPVLAPPRGRKKRGRVKQHKVKNLHDRLCQYKSETLAFLHDFSAPFTNNQGERDVRMAKVKQKISGCFRSIEGARIFARMRGALSTIKKQGHSVLEAMTALFEDHDAFTRRLTEPIAPTK